MSNKSSMPSPGKWQARSFAAFHLAILGTVLCLALQSQQAGAAEKLGPEVHAWLASQANVSAWSADFVQTRFLKTLTQPLSSTGHVWFAAPNKFRWEIGKPAQNVAVRATNYVLLIYPRLKRAEKYPLEGPRPGPWKDALALLEAGFPRSASDLEAQFEVLSQQAATNQLSVVLRPRSASARALMSEMRIEVREQELSATELTFADGSRMRNDFSAQQKNPDIDSALFSPNLPSDYKLVQPAP